MSTVPPKKPATTAVATKTAGTGLTPSANAAPKKPVFQIQNAEARGENRYLKILVYADYGIGKTLLGASAAEVPSMNDVFVLGAESGELTIDDAARKRPLLKNIDSVKITTYKQAARTYEFLKLHCDYRDVGTDEAEDKLRELEAKYRSTPENQIEPSDIEEPKHYRTTMVDSLTELENYCMNQLLGIDDDTGLADDVASAEWSEYKKQHSMVQRLVRAYRDLPMNVIFTAARKFDQDDQKRMLYSPQLTGKLASQVQGFMDVVGYLVPLQQDDKGNIPRRMYVQPTGRYAAKCRFASFKGTYFDDPTMDSILKAVGLLEPEATAASKKK